MFDYKKFRLPGAEYVSASALVPYENNAKLHPDEQVEQIANSIREFGMDDPIGVWENENGELVIVEGHGRLLACEKLGIDEVPIIRLSHLTDSQRRMYTHAHNRINMNSGVDMVVLETELDELEAEFEIEELGFENRISADDFGEEFSLPDGDKSEICQMTFTVHERQRELIKYAMSIVQDSVSETFGNTNKNGNALYEVIKQWAGQRK